MKALHPAVPTLPDKPMYRTPEVAAALDIDLRTLQRIIEGGALSVLRPGHTFRIPRDYLLDYLDSIDHDPLR